jgi:hypothetical protein
VAAAAAARVTRAQTPLTFDGQGCYAAGVDEILRSRGRTIPPADVLTIRALIAAEPGLSR